jgi:hypothetical protein
MLYAFSTNQDKLAARKPKATDNLGRRDYFLYHAWDLTFKAKVIFFFDMISYSHTSH